MVWTCARPLRGAAPWRQRTEFFAGRIVVTSSANGRHTFHLDAHGEVVRREQDTDADGEPESVSAVEREYDEQGRLRRVVSGQQTETHRYDADGAERIEWDAGSDGEIDSWADRRASETTFGDTSGYRTRCVSSESAAGPVRRCTTDRDDDGEADERITTFLSPEGQMLRQEHDSPADGHMDLLEEWERDTDAHLVRQVRTTLTERTPVRRGQPAVIVPRAAPEVRVTRYTNDEAGRPTRVETRDVEGAIESVVEHRYRCGAGLE